MPWRSRRKWRSSDWNYLNNNRRQIAVHRMEVTRSFDRPAITAEHANWPRDVMAFPKWLLQHVMLLLACYTNIHTTGTPHPPSIWQTLHSDLQTFKRHLHMHKEDNYRRVQRSVVTRHTISIAKSMLPFELRLKLFYCSSSVPLDERMKRLKGTPLKRVRTNHSLAWQWE